MAVHNHELTYRPVQGGIAVINLANGRPGTLGAILTRNGADRFALSCYHVLCRPNGGAFPDGETITQARLSRGGTTIGRIFAVNADPVVDCAAALIDPAVPAIGRIFGLGVLAQPVAATVGMRVLKSAPATGITEGEVSKVTGDRVEIRAPTGYPAGYELSDFGDSGAVWVERTTGSPIALHTGVSPNGAAIGVAFVRVVQVLGMTVVVE